jgi:hypothetical protein
MGSSPTGDQCLVRLLDFIPGGYGARRFELLLNPFCQLDLFWSKEELTDEHGVFNIDEAHLYVIGNLEENRETRPRVGLDRMYEPLGNWRMRRTDFARFATGD